MPRPASVFLACAVVLCYAACSREPVPAPEAPLAPKATAPPSQPSAAVASPTPAPPAESSLAIKRGAVVVAADGRTFRPCNEKAPLTLVDQTDGVLSEVLAERKDVTELYVEAYGERSSAAERAPAKPEHAGTLLLEELLYAGVTDVATGCNQARPSYIAAARGNEPSWSAEVGETRVVWKQSDAPQEIVLSAPQAEDSEGAVLYRGQAGEHKLELLIASQACRDSMSGEFFAFTATGHFDDRELKGCARVGQ